jgi:uncharacterized protein involved in response to NO
VARSLEPWRLFFPSALLFAPVDVLLWLAFRDGLVSGPFGASPAWHGREMVFGYAFAVIAGYLLQAMRLPLALALWLLWLAGRLLWLLPPATLDPRLELLLGAAFPVAIAAIGTRRFLSAKRLQNLAFPLVMTGLGVAAVATHAGDLGLLPVPATGPATLAACAVALLILTIGGRAVATGTVGARRLRGHVVRITPRPELEAATALGMLAFIVLDAAGRPRAAGFCALAVAALLALRMTDWRVGSVLHDPETWPLQLGFLWIALGLVLMGLERFGWPALGDAGALHALAAGGIGTVTLTMMIRVARQRVGDRSVAGPTLQVLQLALALAVALRVGGGLAPPGQRGLVLWASALCWAVAFALAAAVLLPAAARREPAGGVPAARRPAAG